MNPNLPWDNREDMPVTSGQRISCTVTKKNKFVVGTKLTGERVCKLIVVHTANGKLVRHYASEFLKNTDYREAKYVPSKRVGKKRTPEIDSGTRGEM